MRLTEDVLAGLLVFPLNNVSTAIGNSVTMSEVAVNFHVGSEILLAGLVYVAVLGVIGGFLSARAAAKKEILTH